MKVDKTGKTHLDEQSRAHIFPDSGPADVMETTGGRKKCSGFERSKFEGCVLQEIEIQL